MEWISQFFPNIVCVSGCVSGLFRGVGNDFHGVLKAHCFCGHTQPVGLPRPWFLGSCAIDEDGPGEIPCARPGSLSSVALKCGLRSSLSAVLAASIVR